MTLAVIAVGVDPGLRTSGAAVALGAALRAAAYVPVPAASVGGDARVNACAAMVEALVAWIAPAVLGVAAALPPGTPYEVVVVLEWPKVLLSGHQRAEKEGADPNDLLPLSGVDVGVAVLLQRMLLRGTCLRVTLADKLPADWKGQVPKDVMCARVLSRLTPEERARLQLRPRGGHSKDELDAVGVLLHHLGRLEPRRGV